MTVSWDDVVALGLALPDVELSTSYGRPAIKVWGKAIAVAGGQPDHFVMMLDLNEVDMLMETEPDVFFQTDHYRGWPTVLVRQATADPERIEALVERAWRRRASARQRKLYDAAGE